MSFKFKSLISLSSPLSQKDLGTFEAKHSLLWSKLVATREALEKSQLDGELVKQEKHELILALEKVWAYLFCPANTMPTLCFQEKFQITLSALTPFPVVFKT